MSDYVLDKELVLSITDIMKSVIPLIAALVASYLTYRFSKKDKIRDHLFTYKVKSYALLAENISNYKRDLDTIIHDLYAGKFNNDYIKNPEQIEIDVRKIISENTLFISERTNNDLKALLKSFSEASEIYVFQQILPLENPVHKLIHIYESASRECEYFIDKLKSDLELHRINTRKRRFLLF